MSVLSLSQLRTIQDKTTLKGIYFFLCLSVTSFILVSIEFLTLDALLNPIQSIQEYLILFSIVSVSTAFLYYMKLEDLLLRKCLSYIGEKNYPNYHYIKFQNCIDHYYIINEKNRFLSKILFIITLFIISLIFFVNMIIIFLLFQILIIPLIVSAILDWRQLSVRLKLIYFIELLIQEGNAYSKNENIQNFVKFAEQNLWLEAKSAFMNFLEKNIEVIANKDFLKSLHIIEAIIKGESNFYEQFSQKDDYREFPSRLKSIITFHEYIKEWDDWMVPFFTQIHYFGGPQNLISFSYDLIKEISEASLKKYHSIKNNPYEPFYEDESFHEIFNVNNIKAIIKKHPDFDEKYFANPPIKYIDGLRLFIKNCIKKIHFLKNDLRYKKREVFLSESDRNSRYYYDFIAKDDYKDLHKKMSKK